MKNVNQMLLAFILGLLVLNGSSSLQADPAAKPVVKPPQNAKQAPDANLDEPPSQPVLFMTIDSPVGEVTYGRVTNAALALQNEAAQSNETGYLVLKISPGSSPFHQVQGLAKFLASSKLSNLKTIAWIPETVIGNNVVLALACDEIVMHPDAELGDIGYGKAIDRDEREFVLSIVEKRHNNKLSRALTLGMMDPQQAVLKIKIQQGEGENKQIESRIVTPEELKRLQDNMAVILDVETIKEVGSLGVFSGSKARALDVLVQQLAQNRGDLAELYGIPREKLRDDPTMGDAPKTMLIRVDGMIEPILEAFIERQINRAVNSGANMLVFEITSGGGYLISGTNLANMIADLDARKVRTVAYVPEYAMSSAAIIALGCDEIFLKPDAQIGDAGPIEMKEDGQFEHVPEKILSPLRVTLKELAEKKGRPAAVCEAMSDKDLEIFEVTNSKTGQIWYMTAEEIHESNGEWIKGPVVRESRKANLLTVNGNRAHTLKIAEPPVRDMEELKQRLGIPVDTKLIAVGRTWVDTLVYVLNSSFVTGLVLALGILFVYLELSTLTGMFGIMSGVCFGLFFWSHILGGTAGYLEIVLFAMGLICILLELLVIPGFGVFGVSGGLLVFASFIMASQTFGDFNTLRPGSDLTTMTNTVGTVSASLITVIILAIGLNRFLPESRLMSSIILAPPGENPRSGAHEIQLDPGLLEESGTLKLPGLDLRVGMQGVTISVLRPAGRVEIEGVWVDVISEGPFIQPGAEVEIAQINGNEVIVREVV
ncbi:NfeD family protein [Gimesia fumaroli]|uniref:Serine dehydrogenase proteinase n=1 Tax=Gimesia fumaroli TaxID=2527976 RepID=A0A518IE30_9PLAN|nr:NfeD family protein [Gimesia fumaroli]QDV51317.1 Serine dehydrogenase proteinase [Gimesia fumaroli]